MLHVEHCVVSYVAYCVAQSPDVNFEETQSSNSSFSSLAGGIATLGASSHWRHRNPGGIFTLEALRPWGHHEL